MFVAWNRTQVQVQAQAPVQERGETVAAVGPVDPVEDIVPVLERSLCSKSDFETRRDSIRSGKMAKEGWDSGGNIDLEVGRGGRVDRKTLEEVDSLQKHTEEQSCWGSNLEERRG